MLECLHVPGVAPLVEEVFEIELYANVRGMERSSVGCKVWIQVRLFSPFYPD
jgi:hypothetical protein